MFLMLIEPSHLDDSTRPGAFKSASDFEEPWALGNPNKIAAAVQIAKRCGVKNVSIVRYTKGSSQGRALVITKGKQTRLAASCMSRWLQSHANEFDPLLGVE